MTSMEMYLVVKTVLTDAGELTLRALCRIHALEGEYHWMEWSRILAGDHLTMFTWEDAQDEVRRRGRNGVLAAAVPVDREYLLHLVHSHTTAPHLAW